MGTRPGTQAHRAWTLAAGPVAPRQRAGLSLVSVLYTSHAQVLSAIQTDNPRGSRCHAASGLPSACRHGCPASSRACGWRAWPSSHRAGTWRPGTRPPPHATAERQPDSEEARRGEQDDRVGGLEGCTDGDQCQGWAVRCSGYAALLGLACAWSMRTRTRHARGNTLVPSGWQATEQKGFRGNTRPARSLAHFSPVPSWLICSRRPRDAGTRRGAKIRRSALSARRQTEPEVHPA
jgi:hypothetical protein